MLNKLDAGSDLTKKIAASFASFILYPHPIDPLRSRRNMNSPSPSRSPSVSYISRNFGKKEIIPATCPEAFFCSIADGTPSCWVVKVISMSLPASEVLVDFILAVFPFGVMFKNGLASLDMSTIGELATIDKLNDV